MFAVLGPVSTYFMPLSPPLSTHYLIQSDLLPIASEPWLQGLGGKLGGLSGGLSSNKYEKCQTPSTNEYDSKNPHQSPELFVCRLRNGNERAGLEVNLVPVHILEKRGRYSRIGVICIRQRT